MAVRTISNAGGNYNNTATWVEGVVPTSADDIVATATSGQLTINVASAARSFNFTNYTNTLTVNAQWTVSGVATQTFVSAMTIAGTANISITGNGAAITTNGLIIPNLSISSNKTLNDNLNVVNFVSGAANFTGNQINCSGNWTTGTSSIGGSAVINFVGDGIISFGSYSGSGGLNFNTAGSLTGSTIGIGLGINTTLNYSAGTLHQMRIKQNSTPVTINGNGVEFETFDTTASGSFTLNLLSEFKVKYFNLNSGNYVTTSEQSLRLQQIGNLNVTNSMNLIGTIFNSAGTAQYKPFRMAFNTGVTHSINVLNVLGLPEVTSNTTGSVALARLISSTSGTRADINLINPSQSVIANTDVIDINFTGPQVYTITSGGTITNSLNVINTTIGSTGSTTSSGGAWTFVN